MAFLNQRNGVNSLFGTYNIAEDDITVTTTNAMSTVMDNNMYDFILRDSKNSLLHEINEVDIKFNIKKNPGKYLKAKNNDLLSISQRCINRFREKYTFYIEMCYGQEEATQKAEHAVNEEKKELLALHKKRFPIEAEKLNLK